MKLEPQKMSAWRLYLYAISFISLIVLLFGAIDLISVLLQIFVYPPPAPYPQPPRYYGELTRSVAQVFIGLIIWGYHWSKLQREEEKKKPLKEAE